MSYVFLIIYLAALSAFGSFVNDMYVPALPEMMRFFGCSVSTVQLGLTTGMAGLAIGQLILGPVSDLYGRKPVLKWSLIMFCAAAIVSIFSPTIHFFLICRFFQGIGASGAYFLARSIPSDIYTGRTLAKVMAVVGAINGFAPACSPVAGGFISDHFDWKAIFIVLTAIAILLLCFSSGLKETHPSQKTIPHAGLWKEFGTYRIMLSNYRFMVHVLLKGAALGLLFAYISSGPFIVQTHFGYSATTFGLIMGGNSIMVAAGSMVALRFKVLKNAAFVGALFLMVTVVVENLILLHPSSTFMAYELALLPMLFCLGMIFTVSNTLAMNEGHQYAGISSAILGIGGYLFGAIASPLVGQGDIMRSSAIVFLIIGILILICAILTQRIPPDLNSPK
ncbi:MAG: multidrug effflux MFS transporter [Muribaculaceae bacterium]|nr:multidrug effflux MFS transporter [Muribaculaceae bacterium]